MNPIYDRLHRVLRTTFEIPADEIDPSASLEDLDLDSIAVTELAVILEEDFRVRLGVNADLGRTLAEIVTEIADQMAAEVRS